MTNENNHLFNSNLIFYNPKDISNFSLLAMEKLLQYTNLNKVGSKIISNTKFVGYAKQV